MIALKEKKDAQVEEGTYDLIRGDYSPVEALEIVTDLFSKKIHFLEVKTFSQEIRFGVKDPNTMKRIEELKLNQIYAKKRIAEAKESGKSLRVSSTISLDFI